MINIKLPPVGMKGFWKIESVHPVTGKRTLLVDWFENTLLTTGSYEMSQRSDWLSSCQVGIDLTNDPNPGFTGMPGWIAGTATIEDNVIGAESTAPYYGWRRIRWRFPVGSIVVNTQINRVGAGWGTSNDSNLTTLAKTVDVGGIPTAVTWIADEFLDVTYEFRYYPPLVDATGTVDFNSVTYNYILRAAAATDQSAWANGIGSIVTSVAGVNSDWLAYDGDIGATIADQPSSSVSTEPSDNSNDFTIAPANAAQISVGMNVGPPGWNVLTGKLMRSLRIKTSAGWYQIQFDSQSSPGNGVPKTDQFTIAVQFTLTWGEATIP